MDLSNNSCYQFDECSVDGMCHYNANCHGFKNHSRNRIFSFVIRTPSKFIESKKVQIQMGVMFVNVLLDMMVMGNITAKERTVQDRTSNRRTLM